MKHTRTLLTALLLAPLAAVHAAEKPAMANKPNIVMIFADDLGWKDVEYPGSDFMETPNLDRLAKEGMVFTAGYAAAGNCAPSRACMLSGNYTPFHYVYAVGSTDRGSKVAQRLIPIPNKSGLAKENVTFADALKSAGYVTGIFGKWHLDGKDGAAPGEQGFDVVYQSYGGWSSKETGNPNRLSRTFATYDHCSNVPPSLAMASPPWLSLGAAEVRPQGGASLMAIPNKTVWC